MKDVGKVRRRGERLLQRGLRMPVEREDLGDALRYLDQRFVAASPEGRATQLAADALALYDATLKANPFIHELACAKGCAYCCYNYVSATAPEIFLIARHVRGCMPEGAVGGVMERLAPATTLGPHERVGRRIACAFLDGSSCSVYSLRPISCRVRATAKADFELCVQEYEGGTQPVAQTNLHRHIGAHVTLLVQIVRRQRASHRHLRAVGRTACRAPRAGGREPLARRRGCVRVGPEGHCRSPPPCPGRRARRRAGAVER